MKINCSIIPRILLIALLFTTSCDDKSEIKPFKDPLNIDQALELKRFATTHNDPILNIGLGFVIQKSNEFHASGKTSTYFDFSQLERQEAIKSFDSVTQNNTYVYFIQKTDSTLTNFVISEKNGIYLGFFMDYLPDDPSGLNDMSLFEGQIKLTSINGDFSDLMVTEGGKATNGRSSVCITETYCWSVDVPGSGIYGDIQCETSISCTSLSGNYVAGGLDTGTEDGQDPLSGYGTLTANSMPETVPVNNLSAADEWEQEICQKVAFRNNECVQDIWNKMKQEDVGFETLINFLGDNPKAELCLDIKDLGSAIDSPNGNTDPRNTGTVTINLNINKLNRSKLSVARTLLHEMIHAELISLVIEAGGYDNFQSYAENYDDEFLAIWNYIEEFEPEGWQHEYMADNYITYIADGLRLLEVFFVSTSFKNAVNNGYYDDVIGESWNWDNFYEYMAWEGLHETDQFQADIVNKNLKSKYDQYRLRFEDGNSITLDCQ